MRRRANPSTTYEATHLEGVVAQRAQAGGGLGVQRPLRVLRRAARRRRVNHQVRVVHRLSHRLRRDSDVNPDIEAAKDASFQSWGLFWFVTEPAVRLRVAKV